MIEMFCWTDPSHERADEHTTQQTMTTNKMFSLTDLSHLVSLS